MDINAGDTAWLLASSALVLLMTPGLAFFYGGLTRAKSTLNMMMMSFVTIGIVSILWALYGFTLAFGAAGSASATSPDPSNGLWGHLSWDGLTEAAKTTFGAQGNQVPTIVFAAFQLMFAIITPALISGSIADRAKFISWSIFMTIWTTIVYFPVAHWVFDFGTEGSGGGWLANWGVEDFAGGTAVHINAGSAALALCLVLGKRIGFRKDPLRPHNVPFVLLGAGLLWFGWFGFNAGSALTASNLAGIAFMNTQLATAAALCAWILVERIRDGRPTSVGAASGAVAGLVAITPACAFLTPLSSILLGILAGAVCALAVGLKYKLGYDDSLDVVGVHLVGGIIGCLFLGFFSTDAINAAATNGLFFGGGAALLGKQAVAAASVFAYSFAIAFVVGWVINKTIGFRITRDSEVEGVDLNEHSETAYEFDTQSSTGGIPSGQLTGVSPAQREAKKEGDQE